jgi:hypothetical protein
MRGNRDALWVALAAGMVVMGCGKVPTPFPRQKPVVFVTENTQSMSVPDDLPAEAPEPADEDFRFPDDKGGQMLAKSLPPERPAPPAEAPSGQRRLPGSPALEQPGLPLPPNQGPVARLPASSRTPLRPRHLPDEVPLHGQRLDPPPPEGLTLPAGERVRLPGVDVNQPMPLPVLAVPAPDRASQGDPTADFSTAAAQSAAPPMRTGPVPFQRPGPPDPFEHRDAVRLRAPPDEGGPVTGPPRPPR